MNKPISLERSAVVALLAEFLSRGYPELSYDQISEHLGMQNIRREKPGAIGSACRIVRREHGIDYCTVRGVGLRRADCEASIAVGRAAIASVHRASRRTLQRLGCAPIAEMTNGQKIAFNAVAAGIGAIGMITQSRTVKKLEAAQSVATERLSLENTLRVFGMQ